MPVRIVSFGEILWDIFDFDESARLGGAPLNFALHATRLGHAAVLISAVGDDQRGSSALAALRSLGIDSAFIRTSESYPTGTARIQLGNDGQVLFQIQRPAAYDDVHLTTLDIERLTTWDPDWLYYGTLSSMDEKSRALLERLTGTLPRARRLYDINLREGSYTPGLVAELASRANAVKLNQDEMTAIGEMFGISASGIEDFCQNGALRYGWEAVAVTLGERGCAIWVNGTYAEADGVRVVVADTVGAGDAFAAAFVHGLSLNWSAQRIGEFANRVGALIASRPGGTPDWTPDEIQNLRM